MGEKSYRHFIQAGHKTKNYQNPGALLSLPIFANQRVAGCHFHALAGTVTARARAFAPSVPQERSRGQGAGEQGGHSWLPCPSTDMRHRPCPSGSAFAAVWGLESTTYD